MSDIWRNENLFGMAALIIALVYFWSKEMPLIFLLLWGYLLLSALFVFQNPWATPFVFYNQDGKPYSLATQMDQTTGQAFSQILLIPLVVFGAPSEVFKYWRVFFISIGVVEAVLLLTAGYGLLNASSFDAAFVATLVTIAPWPIRVFFVFAIWQSERAATAVLILCAQVFSLGVVPRLRHAVFGGGILFLLAAPFIFIVHGFWSDTRAAAYVSFFKWWKVEASYFFGTGVGTFQWVGPAIQKFEGKVYLQMHSDWLQILFEGGATGLVLSLWAYVHLLLKSRKSVELFAATIAVGVFCAFYHPFRFFPTSLFIVCLIRAILESRPIREPTRPRPCWL
jgi:hypothetical protein